MATPDKIPTILYEGADIKFDHTVFIGPSLQDLTNTTTRVGFKELRNNKIVGDNVLTATATNGINDEGVAAANFNIPAASNTLTAGTYQYAIEHTTAMGGKFIVDYGVVIVRGSVF